MDDAHRVTRLAVDAEDAVEAVEVGLVAGERPLEHLTRRLDLLEIVVDGTCEAGQEGAPVRLLLDRHQLVDALDVVMVGVVRIHPLDHLLDTPRHASAAIGAGVPLGHCHRPSREARSVARLHRSLK